MIQSGSNDISTQTLGQFDRKDWASAYCNVKEELTNFPLKAVRGQIPKELSGFFFRNGPGCLERGGQWVHHPFDGDGMITSFHFNNGAINFTNRFVRTEAWQAEAKAEKFLFRGVFGTQKPEAQSETLLTFGSKTSPIQMSFNLGMNF